MKLASVVLMAAIIAACQSTDRRFVLTGGVWHVQSHDDATVGATGIAIIRCGQPFDLTIEWDSESGDRFVIDQYATDAQQMLRQTSYANAQATRYQFFHNGRLVMENLPNEEGYGEPPIFTSATDMPGLPADDCLWQLQSQ